tara:strand:+ start:516 stop:1640 length:1125 start_codon:yes stop_codon:yes gene_type:complete
MHVLHVITGLGDGGAEGVLFRLIKGTPHIRHTVLSLGTHGKYGPLLQPIGVQIICLNLFSRKFRFFYFFQSLLTLAKTSPTLIQSWMYHADLFASILKYYFRCPLFWSIRNSNLRYGSSKLTTIFLVRILSLLSHFIPHKIINCSYSAFDVHTSLGYSSSKMLVIHNGIDCEIFKPNPFARSSFVASYSLDPSLPIFGKVARFDPQKDHETLLRAFSLYVKQGYDGYLFLAGSNINPSNLFLSNLIQVLGISSRVFLIGPCADVPFLMSSLDIHLLSSSYGEGFPNVVAEAMSCGTPVISTIVGDSPQIIGNTGWLVPISDSEALANALVEAASCMKTPSVWSRMQLKAHLRITQNYNVNRMIRRFSQTWSSPC